MTELQSLSAYPASAPPAVEEISVKARKPDDEKFGFFDFLDIINPLQHIPIVNTIYREMTGDEIKPPAKMIGSALIGGPVGLAVAMADSVIEDTTGKDMGGHAMAWVRGDAADEPDAVTVAAQALQTAPAQTAGSTPATGREFIPAMVAAAQATAQPLFEESEDDKDRNNTEPRPEQTEAAIAASAAAAPRGLVFMPLPGRGQAQAGPATKRVDAAAAQRFMPLNTTDRAAPRANEPALPPAAAARAAMTQVQTALAGYRPSASDSANALLEATKPKGDTGDLPPLDPFAAAREVSGQGTGPMQVPSWFDRAMMDAMDKYRTMQNAS